MSFDTLPDGIDGIDGIYDEIFNQDNAPQELKDYIEEHILENLVEQFVTDSLTVSNYTINVEGTNIHIHVTLSVISPNTLDVLIPELNTTIRSICNLGSNIAEFSATIQFPGNDQYLRPSQPKFVNKMYTRFFYGRGTNRKRKSKRKSKRKKYNLS